MGCKTLQTVKPRAKAPTLATPGNLGRLYARNRTSFLSLLDRARANRWTPIAVLLLLTAASFVLRVIWLDKPKPDAPGKGLIFDEAYYVNAARIILHIPVVSGGNYSGSTPGLDPNSEHPPLVKLFIVLSMRIFGDNGVGWRLPSVIFGTASIPLVYGVVRGLGGAASLALLATYFYAFDNLVLVQSRIGTLDIFMLAFMLLGVYLYVKERPVLAGLAFTLATLCKIGGLYGVAAIVLFEALRFARERVEGRRWAWMSLRPLLIMGVAYLVSVPWLLGVLDSLWSSYKNPLDHLNHIFGYGLALKRQGGPAGQESNPWQWLLNERELLYWKSTVTSGDLVRPTIWFRGAMNPVIIGAATLGLVYSAWRAWRYRDALSFWVVAWVVVNYLVYYPLSMVEHRVSYLYYFLPTIPAVAVGLAQFLYAPELPRVVRWAYIGMVLVGFYGYFPFRVVPT